jgi:hypothetical protein
MDSVTALTSQRRSAFFPDHERNTNSWCRAAGEAHVLQSLQRIQSTVSAVQPIGGCDSKHHHGAGRFGFAVHLNNALLPVAHVINMSLGGGGGPDNPTAIAASSRVNGAIVVAASELVPGEVLPVHRRWYPCHFSRRDYASRQRRFCLVN